MSIKKHIKDLKMLIGPARKPANIKDLRAVYKQKGLKGLVYKIQQDMKLQDISLVIAYVNSGGPKKSVAWIQNPRPMPIYGSSDFKKLKITIFFRREFLENAMLESIIFAIAHELSHTLLYSLNARFAKHEKAVDVTAMYHGYGEMYQKARNNTFEILEKKQEREPEGFIENALNALFGVEFNDSYQVAREYVIGGYLSCEEIDATLSLIKQYRD